MRKPVEKKVKVKKIKIKSENLDWLKNKLSCSDNYFSISFGL